MTRVLLLIKGLGRGGAEQLLVNAAPYFDRTEFDYEIAYLLPHKDALVGELRDAGLRVTCLGGQRGMSWIIRLRALVEERGIDLIHAHSPYAAIGTRIAFGRRRPRLVTTEHIVWESYHRATYWANMITFARNDYALAVSDSVRRSIRYVRPLSFMRMPPLETVYYGPDQAAVARWGSENGVRAELGIPDDVPIVGNIANFKAKKDHATLLRAALEVRKAVPGVRFVLVGTGPDEDRVKRQANELGLNDTVVFTGFRKDATRVARSFDVFVLSSIHEGLSIALIEAMMLGKPAIVTRVGGLPEVVEDGTNGLLVPPRKPNVLARAITRVLADDGLRAALAEGAIKRAGEFDIRTAVARSEELYRGLVA